MLKLLLPLILLAFSGCATLPTTTYVDRERTYNKDFETTWSKTIEMVTKENFPIKSMDKQSGIIQTDYGKDPLQDTWINKARCSLNLLVSPVDESHTKVSINPYYEIYLPGPIGIRSNPGEWIVSTDKDKKIVDKYFSKLNSLLS
jgi:hypothetical protein